MCYKTGQLEKLPTQDASHQAVVDGLQEIAESGNIPYAKAQEIMAKGKLAADDPGRDTNARDSGARNQAKRKQHRQREREAELPPATEPEDYGQPTSEDAVWSSEDALALQFAGQYFDDLRFVAAWSRWLRYNGVRWLTDERLETFDDARKICRATALQANEAKARMRLSSASTVSAVERLARSDQRLAATVDQWDQDPWLLNTSAGTVNLKTGVTQGHRREDYITKIAATPPGGTCDLWREFIATVTGNDDDLADFIQRMLGYSLTGLTREHCLFFLYGTGANGKSVLLNTVSSILADYHTTAPIETFTASVTDRHPTELAGLRGARLVTAIETEEGRRWAEAKVKSLTGGDPIAARFMRQDFFTFTPQFKLIVAGNHKPSLRTVDEAIRRRFHLVPFTVTIPPANRDKDLPNKLTAEWPGIFQWMIDGCLAWQREGLNPPAAVREATAAYLDAEDAIAAWISDCCTRDPNAWSSSTALFGSWSAWARRGRHHPGRGRRRGRYSRHGVALGGCRAVAPRSPAACDRTVVHVAHYGRPLVDGERRLCVGPHRRCALGAVEGSDHQREYSFGHPAVAR